MTVSQRCRKPRGTCIRLLIPSLLFIPSLAGCGPKIDDETRHEMVLGAIDQRFGGVPEGFPEDVPIYPGTRGITPYSDKDTVALTGSNDASVKEVVAFYEKTLPEHAWQKAEDKSESGGMTILQYSKDARRVYVTVNRDQWGKTSLMLDVRDESVPPEPSEPDDPQARAVLDKMAERYATCRSYRDTGVVETTFLSDSRVNREPFMTAFQRPDHFRFEFKDRFPSSKKWHYMIVHCDPSGTRVWSSLDPGVEEVESLELALAGATGVSSGSAHTIPSLILNETDSHRLTDLQALKLLPDAELDGATCYCIEGKNWRGDVEVLWIDKTNLLRRIEEEHELPSGRVRSVTTYAPEINIEIPPEELEFHKSGRL